MVRCLERLINYSLVALDTSIFIYHFEANFVYGKISREILQFVESGNIMGVTSVITLMEILVKPLALNRLDVARKYEILLKNFPNLSIVEIDHECAHKASVLRAKYQIKPADALQIAAFVKNGADIFITNDQRYNKLRSVIDIMILSDYKN